MSDRIAVATCGLVFLLAPLACDPVLGQTPPAGQAPDPAQWTVSLNGTWEFAAPGSEDLKPAKVPGFWGSTPHANDVGFKAMLEWTSATYRRAIEVPTDNPGAALEFDQLRWGGEVLVNGQSAGTYDLGHSPADFDISRLIKPGRNDLAVRTCGWAGLKPRELIPTGAGNWFGIKDGGIPDDVTLRFYKGARIDRLRIAPRIAGPSCDLTTRVVAGPKAWRGRLAVQVLTDDGKQAVSAVKRVDVSVKAAEALDVTVTDIQCPQAQLWWTDKPALYRLVAWLEAADGSVASVRDDTFGFREVATRDGHFHLNGRRMALFGATELVMYRLLELLENEQFLRDVQVTLFKQMNAVAFRSHMNPLPRKWIDLCDRNGVLLLCEFPNFPDVQAGGRSPYEVPGYWENLQREIRGIITDRYNHPCIVAWVPSNEGTTFGDWERAHLVPFVKAQDPSRLVMLSGDVTPDIADQHNFAGIWWATYGQMVRGAAELARFYRDRIVGCTEYGQFGGGKRWYGPRDRPEPEQFQLDIARIHMEQTEAMRRSRFDVIMYYAYGGAGFNRQANRPNTYEEAGPPYHALRNALSPLGVSIDFRRHAAAGKTLEVPVWAMSDAEDVKGPVEVSLHLVESHPGYKWDGMLDGVKVIAQGSYAADLAPWQALYKNVKIALPPDDGGAYWLAATIRPKGQAQATAISLKALRIHAPPPKATKPLAVGVIEADGRLEKWLKARGHRPVLAYGDAVPDVILVGEGMLYDDRTRTHGGPLTTRVRDGARMVVLEQRIWDADVLQQDIKLPVAGVVSVSLQTGLENLFPEPGLEKAVGSAADFERLNGLDNVALRVALAPSQQTAPAAATQQARLTPEAQAAQTQGPATQPSVWSGLLLGYGVRGDTPVWAVARRDFEKGQVLACQVPLTDRVCTDNPADFDPVAERLLAWLIEGSGGGTSGVAAGE